MEESEDNMSSEDLKSTESSMTVKSKPKKRSLIERELETSLTARITSPVNTGDGTSTSRYGRARRLKSEMEQSDMKKVTTDLKSPLADKSPVIGQTQSPVYKMHASNSPLKRAESPKKVVVEKFLDNQIESIYQENISLSRFGNEEITTVTPSPVKKFPKVYIRKDLIQKREPEDTVTVIQNMFSPVKSTKKSSNTHLNNILERSSERYSLNSKPQNGYLDNSSVVKTLDFDSKKKKKENKDIKSTPSKSELFELEAKCAYQVGDLAWARMGTYPFWPSIVTRDPATGVFVKKKLFGRIERDIIHVTFFGDNGRRSWIVDSMLRKYLGQLEFEAARENFTPEAKKKDPRLYAAYFVSEKKLPLWNASVEEAEMLLREPKRLRIDIFHDMLEKSRSVKVKQPKSKISRTDSDVSLSESLYDSLFSEDDGKSDNNDRSRNRTRNKSLDMFEVVTACLDNMAAKTGITKIQKQSHMDRWLQKAKSKTPEKTKAKPQVPIKKLEEKKTIKVNGAKKKKSVSTKRPVQKGYSLRKMNDSQNMLSDENEPRYSINTQDDNVGTDSDQTSTDNDSFKNPSQELCGIGVIAKVESLANETTVREKSDESAVIDLDIDSSVNMNRTHESETYTDECLDSSNVCNSADNNTDVDKSDLNVTNEDTDPKNSNNESKKCSTELKEPANSLDSDLVVPENQDKCEKESAFIETPNEIQPVEMDNVGNQDSNELNESTNSELNESVSHNEAGLEKRYEEPNSELESKSKSQNDLEVEETFPMETDPEVDNTIESKNDTVCSLTTNEVSTDTVDTNTEYNQSTEVARSNIETENISQDTSNIAQDDKDSCAPASPKYTSTKGPSLDENEADNMYTDEDSDSERLPYSPLSNLGNNSDDNLSLNDVPFMNDNETENNDNTDKIPHSVDDNNAIHTCNNLSNNNEDESDVRKEKINKIDKEDFLKDVVPMDVDNSLSENIVENGYISDDNVIQNKTKNSDEAKKEINVHRVKNISKENKPDSMENISNGYRGKNVKEILMSTKEVSINVTDCCYKNKELIKENGYHSMNGDCDLETVSLYSEDSVTSTKSESRRKLRSRQDKKQEDPLENPEFAKYVELRQDAIMDENPELNEKEIVAYLYKTWLYEESGKSDVKKNDDLRELNSVKGLNQPQNEPVTKSKRNLSLNKRETSKPNTLQRFLRSKKDIEHTNIEDDEICPYRKRGVRKNMVKDDEDDNASINKDVTPGTEQNSENIPSKLESNEKCNDKEENLPNEDVLHTPTKTDESKKIKEVSLKVNETESPDIVKDSTIPTPSTKSAEEAPKMDTKIGNNITEMSDPVSKTPSTEKDKIKLKDELDKDSIDSEDSEAPLIRCKLRSKAKKENEIKESSVERKINDDVDTISINSEDSEISVTKRKKKLGNKKAENAMDDPEFVKYLELRQDALIEENPELTQEEIVTYLYQTWLYEENTKSEINKTDDIDQSSLVKGLTDTVQQPKKIRRKVPKTEKTEKDSEDVTTKDKPKRKSVKPFYNEEYSDIEEELEVFEIFKPKVKDVPKAEPSQSVANPEPTEAQVEVYDEVELYFAELTKPKPNVFKGLIREKVCEICDKIGCLVKCKGCSGMFHVDCVKKQIEPTDVPVNVKGRKKKKKPGRKPKNSDEFDDDKSQDVSEDNNASIEEILDTDSHAVDADVLEAQLSAKMKEILDSAEKIDYESYSSDDGLDWNETVPGKCEIIDVKLKPKNSASETDYSNFKCNNCQQYNTPVCFVCKGAVSKKDSTKRQKCHVAHCYKYYHLDCLDQWPQTQFNGGEPSKNNKKINEHFEPMSCPRHVCHTCVSDDPRGCKTRFSGDKLARCVRCPATYHSFTKCLPAGTQILTASHIICPRHYEHRPGKVPCHVNTGWCFICALGGSLICCEYCPTSFHAECLNIDPPEGGYMCEDCETGRLPLYGEMVWVKLGHYRWWPGIILHPYEIPENLMAVKHSLGEFVVRFFGQYDHYWVNRGRVFPFQEGDSGRISSQKSKIDAAFTTAMEHAQRACEILKTLPNEEESIDIASSLLPPHYVKLKVNKPCGSLCGRRLEDPESSLTQCECNPADEDPCGPYSQCLNRMLLTECGPTCRAADRCNNRAFEKRLYPKLVPYRTPSRGWGLKTLEDIKAGQFVIEYVGELIDEEEFRRRMRRKHEIRDENFYFLTLDKERMIDAGPKGNLARFMNHCCEPNCETQKWTVLGDVRVGLFALFDIPAHSEVTFNYNLECAGIDKKRCMCGAKRCSGYIGAKPKQDESQSKKNKMQPGKRTYKKRKPEESPSTKNKPKRPLGRPPKPRELTEIEKDLLIIKNATNGLSSDESSRSLSSEFERNPKALKRKRVSFSTEEVIVYDGTESPSVKKSKIDVKLEGN